MLTASAESHFGGRAGIARALSNSRTVSAVYQWGPVVPKAAAKQLALKSGGALQVDEALYDEFGHIIRKSDERTSAVA